MPKLFAGDKLPDLTVDTVNKSGVKLSEIVCGKPTAFMILRYIGCTVCRYDVHLLTQRYAEFEALGANVAVVMQSPAKKVLEDLAGTSLPFNLICDPEQIIYKTFDVAPAASMDELLGDSLPKLQVKGAAAEAAGFKHGDYEGIEEQLPAFLLVGGDMIIKEAHYAKNIMDMPTIDEILAKLK